MEFQKNGFRFRPVVLSKCRMLRNIKLFFIVLPDLNLTLAFAFSDTGFGTTSGGAFGTSAFGSSSSTGSLFGNSQTKPGRGLFGIELVYSQLV